MSKQYVCDRCGKTTEEVIVAFSPSKYHRIVVDEINYDLCEKCAKALKPLFKKFLAENMEG